MRLWSRSLLLSSTLAIAGLGACGGGGGGGAVGDGNGDAAPVASPPLGTSVPADVQPCAIADLPAQALAEVNAARTSARTCRGTLYPAVATLAWNNQLAQAAAVQAADMAANDYVDHTRAGHSTVAGRIEASGYRAGGYGENLAGGPTTVTGVVDGWLASTKGHCENIMDATSTRPRVHMGLACYRRPGTRYVTYWALVMARPQP